MPRAPLKTEPVRNASSLVAQGFLGLLMLAQAAMVWQVVAQNGHALQARPTVSVTPAPPAVDPTPAMPPAAAPGNLALTPTLPPLPPAPVASTLVPSYPVSQPPQPMANYAGTYATAPPLVPPSSLTMLPPAPMTTLPPQPAPAPARTYLPPMADHFGNEVLADPAAINTSSPAWKKSDAAIPRPTLPPGRQIKDPQVAAAVAAARDVRKKGDMVNALEAFKTADSHEPNHPEILSEIAITYEMIELRDKAEAYWHRVMAMGEDAAGGYYVLAKERLSKGAFGGDVGGGTPEGPAGAGAAPVMLGSCEARPDPTFLQGEKVTLRVPIKAKPNGALNSQGINVRVFFFNQLANGSVEVSKEEPPYRWASTKWSSPEGGLLEADYVLPVQSPAFAQSHGGLRRYCGWMVRLYYENKLVGQQASSDDLLNVGPQAAAPTGADNALFPRN